MITYVVGNLFESPAHVLVNTVNTEGVMGKGIAKDFKTIFPDMFKKYQKLCEEGKIKTGSLWLYKTPNKWVLNFPTKTTWRRPSKLEYIEEGLKAFVNGYARNSITSIAFPPLGCGNGELNWEKQVRPLMEKYLNRIPIDIFIHLYRQDTVVPEHHDIKKIAEWLRLEPESLGFAEVWLDLKNIIGSGLQLETLNNKQKFQASLISGVEEGVCLKNKDCEKCISQEDLMEFWNLIRSYGFAMENLLTGSVAPVKDYLISLFAKLPYCRPVRLTPDYKELNEKENIGIQWMPRSMKSDVNNAKPYEVRAA